jgi:predicted nucleotidyltransferase
VAVVNADMSEPETPSGRERGASHEAAATAFARRVRGEDLPGLEALILFGSTARGEASGLDSDVDFLAVVADGTDRSAIEERLRDVAYDVMLEFGPVVEVHVLSRSEIDRYHELGHPFVRRVFGEGESYV